MPRQQDMTAVDNFASADSLKGSHGTAGEGISGRAQLSVLVLVLVCIHLFLTPPPLAQAGGGFNFGARSGQIIHSPRLEAVQVRVGTICMGRFNNTFKHPGWQCQAQPVSGRSASHEFPTRWDFPTAPREVGVRYEAQLAESLRDSSHAFKKGADGEHCHHCGKARWAHLDDGFSTQPEHKYDFNDTYFWRGRHPYFWKPGSFNNRPNQKTPYSAQKPERRGSESRSAT